VDRLLAPVRWLRNGTALHRTLSFGYIRQRWMRTGLIVAVIALGVAVLVATRALSGNINKAAQNAANPLSGKTHVLVTNGQSGVPRSVVERLDQEQAAGIGIRDVEPMTFARVVLPELNNRSILLIGIRPPRGLGANNTQSPQLVDDEALGLRVEWTAKLSDLTRLVLRGRTPVFLSSELANDLADVRTLSTPFHMRLAGREKTAECVGTVHVLRKEDQFEKNVVFLSTADAAALVFPDRDDYVSQVNLILDHPQEAGAICRRLREIIGRPYNVQTVEENFEAVKDITAGLELGVDIGGAGALVVGLFLVYNALSVSVAERRHDIGILRSVGATRGQIAGLFVGEAAFLGLFGSFLGLPLGYALARIALGPLSRMISEVFAPLESPEIEISARTLWLAIASGMATTIFAALIPAVQASLEEPADAVRRVPVVLHFLYRLVQAGAAGLLVAAGIACVVLRPYLPLRFGVFSGLILIFVGAFVATPILASFLSRFFQPFFRRLFGLEGRLAADNLARSPGRTGLVIAALAATGSLMLVTAGFIRSSEVAIFDWLDEHIAADLFVTAGASITDKASEAMPMDEKLGKDLANIPGVEAALPVRLHYLEFRERIIVLVALDADAFHGASEEHALARNLERYPRLSEPGTALVSNNFAALYGYQVGDHLWIDGPDRPLEVEIIGSVLDYTWNRGTIIVNRSWYRENYRDTQVNIFDVYLKKDADRAAVRETIRERWGRKDAVFVVSRDEFRDAFSVQLRKVYSVMYAQEVVVGMVALLGVLSALFISVLQRRRELGLLRAVGASQAQVLRSVLAEAFQMGVIGGLLGFGVGLLLEWYVLHIMVVDEAHFVFPMVVPWLAAGVVFAASVLTASLVGLWPAWHATRIRIAEAIAYE
jgi:putative ABC transport system permease protein